MNSITREREGHLALVPARGILAIVLAVCSCLSVLIIFPCKMLLEELHAYNTQIQRSVVSSCLKAHHACGTYASSSECREVGQGGNLTS